MPAPIHVFPHMRIRAWTSPADGDAFALSTPYPLGELLCHEFDTDAMAVGYSVPGETRVPRLAMAALPHLASNGSEPVLNWAFFDIDNEGHEPWDSLGQAEAAMAAAIQALPPRLQDSCGGYTTRAGYRLMWELSPPVACSRANSLLRQLGELVETSAGIQVDPASYEWTRLFRVPRALRGDQRLDTRHDAEPLLLDGEVLRWEQLGLNLQQHLPAPFVLDPPPEQRPFATADDWAKVGVVAPGWLVRGEAMPADEAGSTYPTLRTALARLAACGEIEDPETLYAMVLPSVYATPGRTEEEAWKLASWVASRQADTNAQSRPSGDPPSVPTHPSREEWDTLVRSMDVTSNERKLLERIAAGDYPNIVKDRREGALRQAVKLLMQRLDDADQVYRHVFASARRVPNLNPVKLRKMCEEERQSQLRYQQAAGNLREYVQEHPLLVSHGKALYIADIRTGRYHETTADEILANFQKFTAPGLPPGLAPEVVMDQPTKYLLKDYGQTVQEYGYRQGVRGFSVEATPDGGHRLLEGVHPPADIEPVYHRDVAKWLALLAGPDTAKLLDWLASVPNLSRPTAALYLNGPPGCGKTLLSTALALLWGDGNYVDYNAVLSSDFNETLLDSPVVVADEGISVDRFRVGRVSSHFRHMVTGNNHNITRKGKTTAHFRGHFRVLIAANNDDGLPLQGGFTGDDLAAITERVLYIKCSEAAREHLRNEASPHPGAAPLARRIAQHVMWLYDTREYVPGPRFLVAGEATEFHERLTVNHGTRVATLEAVYNVLADRVMDPSVQVWSDADSGTVRVSLESFRPAFNKITSSSFQWSRTVKDIKGLSAGCFRLRRNSQRVRYWSLPWALFINASITTREDLENLATIDPLNKVTT